MLLHATSLSICFRVLRLCRDAGKAQPAAPAAFDKPTAPNRAPPGGRVDSEPPTGKDDKGPDEKGPEKGSGKGSGKQYSADADTARWAGLGLLGVAASGLYVNNIDVSKLPSVAAAAAAAAQSAGPGLLKSVQQSATAENAQRAVEAFKAQYVRRCIRRIRTSSA